MPTDSRVDQYIAEAPSFAKPILKYLRDLVHQGCPDVEESIKWSRAVFLYRKKILFSMAAFKAHCSFGFWNSDVNKLLADDGIKLESSSGSLGRITELTDLPSKQDLLRYIREARRLSDEVPSVARPRKRVAAKPPLKLPPDLAASLAQSKAASEAFHALSPSHRREYIEWITQAKRDETRQKRISTTLEWLTEGKPRDWKYMSLNS